VLQCVASWCSVLQRVVVSQQAKRRNTPCHKGCVLKCVLLSVNRQRGGIFFAIRDLQATHGSSHLVCDVSLLFLCVVDRFFVAHVVHDFFFKGSRWRGGMYFGAWLTCVAVCCRILQRVAAYCSVL